MASWWEQQFKSGSSWKLLGLILLLGLVFVLVVCSQKTNVPGVQPVKDFCFGCVLPTSDPTTQAVLTSWRGNNYLLDAKEVLNKKPDAPSHPPKSVNCILTGWGASHIALYFLIGFVVPKLFVPILLISVIWELMEALIHCHDALDIVWNLSGFILGASVRIAMGI